MVTVGTKHIPTRSIVSPRWVSRGALRRAEDCSAGSVEAELRGKAAEGELGKSFMNMIVSGIRFQINLQPPRGCNMPA
jgi:hypothetical protein